MTAKNEIMNEFRRKLRLLEREIDLQLSDKDTCCGVTLSQCHVILELQITGALSITELCRILELDKSTLSRTIDNLTESGFVIRKTDAADRRYLKVSLSEKGKNKAAKINSICNAFYNRLFSNIPKDKHNSVIEGLSLLADSMNALRKENTVNCCSGKKSLLKSKSNKITKNQPDKTKNVQAFI